MQKKKQIKEIILITIIVMILLLIMFSEDIMKLQNKNKIGLSENAEQELTNITNEPNVPTTSAGMIPIKWDGNYWTITTKDDNSWYDYANNQPAYIMLNDGTYQSELIRDMEGKKLAKQNIGAQIQETEIGTIFVWIPRFAYNDNNEEEINYIKDTGTVKEDWTIPELFEYRQEDETKPDYILTGAWVEKEIDTITTSKITEMSKEEGTYGFLAHTKATQISTNEITGVQKYTLANILEDITNQNRITLKVIDENKQDPIKVKAYYSEILGVAGARVTYSQYGISKIIYDETELEMVNDEGIILANTKTKGIFVTKGEHKITIIDNKNNIKKFYVYKNKIYVNLYSDGTLVFSTKENLELNKELVKSYGDIQDEEYDKEIKVPWYYERANITTVMFNDMIYPHSTSYWFWDCNNLTTFENMSKLRTNCTINMSYMFTGCSSLTELYVNGFNTKNVTDMYCMFHGCSSLTELDLRNFDTSKVTDMYCMFYGCSSLTKLLSNFNTSNVTDMFGMFGHCTVLTELDLSSFNTSNVTNMWYMFEECSALTKLDLSNFDTSNVIDMRHMFIGCSKLTSLDVSNFDTSKVTNMHNMFRDCTSLTKLDLSSFNTNNVTDMGLMFYNCNKLTSLNVSNFDTSNVIDMRGMFYGCSSLAKLDVSNFDTSNVTDMGIMFYNCNKLTSLNVSNFNTSNVIGMGGMFYGCSSLTELNVSNFDTSNVTDMGLMFYNCNKLTSLDLKNFDTSNVTNMSYMFRNCTKLKKIYVGANWITSQADTSSMFNNCGTSSVTKK